MASQKMILANGVGVSAIQTPPQWIFHDVPADEIQGFVVANDVFKIIPLPQSAMKRRPMRLFNAAGIQNRGNGFEHTHNITNCKGNPCGCPFVGRHKARPYGDVGNDNNAVNVVGHNYKRVQFCVREWFRQTLPIRQKSCALRYSTTFGHSSHYRTDTIFPACKSLQNTHPAGNSRIPSAECCGDGAAGSLWCPPDLLQQPLRLLLNGQRVRPDLLQGAHGLGL